MEGDKVVEIPTIRTPRLLLREWVKEDLEPFAAMNQDSVVMRFFPSLLTRPESDAFARQTMEAMSQKGWGRWAVEVPGIEPFIGYIGLTMPSWETPFPPCPEIVWRLASAYWGQGMATEGAKAVMEFAFRSLGLPEIFSCTSVLNLPSIRVMERLEMTHNPEEDFEHPKVEVGHPLRRHVLYRKCTNAR
jgi:ribosomal-protein-alanine N-acetyltransferase